MPTKAAVDIRKLVFLSAWAVIIFTLLSLVTVSPFSKVFEYNADEGWNLMRARLVSDGYSLYRDIWSDQPPLFPTLLSLWGRLFGLSAYSARILVLLFACALLYAFYHTLKILHGSLEAILACLFLVFSLAFLRLSVSAMIGIPSLSLAMLSVYGLARYSRSRKSFPLILSSILLALSLHIKFSAAMIIPVLIVFLIMLTKKSPGLERPRKMPSCFLWLFSGTIIYLFICWLYFPNPLIYFQQLFSPHIQKYSVNGCDFSLLLNMLFQDFDLVIIALLTLFFVKSRWLKLPLIWILAALVVFSFHRPIWYHYYPLLALPLSWIAGCGMASFLKKDKPGTARISKTVILLFSLLLLIGFKSDRAWRSVWDGISTTAPEILAKISQLEKSVRWCVTDSIFAFYAGLPVPPETAVLSLKTNFVRPLSIPLLERYKPELVIMARTQQQPQAIASYLKENYEEHKESVYSIPLWEPRMIPNIFFQRASAKFSFLIKNDFWRCRGYFQKRVLLSKKVIRKTEISIYVKK